MKPAETKIAPQTAGVLSAEAMIAAHGKDFAMGALILSARFIAEGRPLTKRVESVSDWKNAAT